MSDYTSLQLDWRKTLLPAGSSLQEAITSLEASSLQIVLVVDSEGVLQGTLTDGDIRRAFLKGYGLEHSISDIISRHPTTVGSQMPRETVLQIMRDRKINQIPVVDEGDRVVDLHFWDEMVSGASLNNVMVIMAGGKGTRMRPHTENCPKPMLDVGGKPMLQHIIERARTCGVSKFIIAVNYLGEMIVDYFGDGRAFDVEIKYVQESSPLGTAGALSLLDFTPQHPLLISNGDVLSSIRYDEILHYHTSHQASATMAVRPHEMQNPFGVVATDGVDIVEFEEKPIYRSHINAGVYVVEPDCLPLLVKNEACDMPILFDRIRQEKKRTVVYPIHEAWLDVGRPSDLRTASLSTDVENS